MADYLSERYMKYGIGEFMVPAVITPQTVMVVAAPESRTLGEFMESQGSVPE